MEAVTAQQELQETSKESLYRTRWLMAHNRLHAMMHGKSEKPLADLWKEYLDELQSTETVAATPA